MTVTELLDALWRDYTASTPQAARIHALFRSRGETIFNDHVALRGFGRPATGLAVLSRPFLELGWEPADEYVFPDKHLVARSFRHADPALPKIFISELEVDALSPSRRAIVDDLVSRLPPGFASRPDVCWSGRPWPLTFPTYRELLEESEYAAWVAAFGFRVNHFTVDVNRLTTFHTLAGVNDFLLSSGIALNTSGGLIKGTPAQRLEQSSTLADPVEVTFDDGVHRIPSCYYEFARRYPLPDGTLFHGFVPTSADRLFESTDARR